MNSKEYMCVPMQYKYYLPDIHQHVEKIKIYSPKSRSIDKYKELEVDSSFKMACACFLLLWIFFISSQQPVLIHKSKDWNTSTTIRKIPAHRCSWTWSSINRLVNSHFTRTFPPVTKNLSQSKQPYFNYKAIQFNVNII
jgi:hypothetical protein